MQRTVLCVCGGECVCMNVFVAKDCLYTCPCVRLHTCVFVLKVRTGLLVKYVFPPVLSKAQLEHNPCQNAVFLVQLNEDRIF